MIGHVLFGLGIATLWASAAGLLAHRTFRLQAIWAVGIAAAVFATLVLFPITMQAVQPDTPSHSQASLP